MKQISTLLSKKAILSFMMALFMSVTAFADNFEVDGISYNILSGTKNVEVARKGTTGPSGYSGAFTIPSTITYDGITYTVTGIGDYAFYNSQVTSITIPSTVTSIYYDAFWGAKKLEAFYGQYASSDNRCLIQDGKMVGFASCGLTDYTIPSTVTALGKEVFGGLYSLTSVTLPNSIQEISCDAFYYCRGLKAFYGQYASSDNRCLVKDGTLKAFAISGLKEYTIPTTVTTIGDSAFADVDNLTSIVIPNSVTSIGKFAFCGCVGLTSINLPNSVTSIGDYAFIRCNKVTRVILPNSLKYISGSMFSGCKLLTDITIPSTVSSIGRNAFSSCGSLKSITIPESVAIIDTATFSRCSSLTDVILPSSLKRINDSGFMDCTSLASIDIPNTVKSIEALAFYGCSSLSSVTLPSSLDSLGSSAFSKCVSLTSLTIPHAVTYFKNNVFMNCTSLSRISCKLKEPNKLKFDTPSLVFSSSIYGQCQLVVPAGSKSQYKAIEPWSNFTNIVEAPKGDLNYDCMVNAADVNTLVGHILTGVGNMPDGVEMVDLGLPSGTLWANMNIGATEPTERGTFFAWGETEPKAEYTWDNYLCSQAECGTDADPLKDLTSISGTAYDAARAKWGGSWRMPTKAEVEELLTGCTWTRAVNTRITGPNGKSIVIPASQIISLKQNLYSHYYWISDKSTTSSEKAARMTISERVKTVMGDRYLGFPIRPVSSVRVVPNLEGDMNGDGNVNAADVNTLVGIILQGGN